MHVYLYLFYLTFPFTAFAEPVSSYNTLQ